MLKFYEKRVYGRTLNMPHEEIKESWRTLTGKASALPHHLQAMTELAIDYVIDPLPENKDRAYHRY